MQEARVAAVNGGVGGQASSTIGKLKWVSLHTVFQYEAHDITTWLAGNIDALCERLDLDLSDVRCEQRADPSRGYLVATDRYGDLVVIESLLERGDHDDFARLIIGLSATRAKTAIWIVDDPQPEQIVAFNWLNERSSAAFYLVRIEAVQIGDSEPAPFFTMLGEQCEEPYAIFDIQFASRAFEGTLEQENGPNMIWHLGADPSLKATVPPTSRTVRAL